MGLSPEKSRSAAANPTGSLCRSMDAALHQDEAGRADDLKLGVARTIGRLQQAPYLTIEL